MSPRVLVVRFRKALCQVLEDVTHINRLDFLGRHIRALLAEVADNLVEQWSVGIHQAVYHGVEAHAREDVLDIFGEAVHVIAKVIFDVGRVGF